MSIQLNHIAKKIECSAFFYREEPAYFKEIKTNVERVVINPQNISKNRSVDTLCSYLLNEKLVCSITENARSSVGVLGANLFPYGAVAIDAVAQTKKNLPLVIVPVGSDIWRVGARIPNQVKYYLSHPCINHVATYSECFAEEIQSYFHIRRSIEVIPPIVDSKRYFPLSKENIRHRKLVLNLPESRFIVHHHSSMRPIKCPKVVIKIVRLASESFPCTLILEGPMPDLRLENERTKRVYSWSYKEFSIGNLEIVFTGLSSDPSFLMQISDVELNASLHDSFNLALQEAMACGIPVVSSDTVGIAPHIIESGAGYVFKTKRLTFDLLAEAINTEKLEKYFDIDAAVSELLQLANDKSFSEKIRYTAPNYCRTHFDANLITNKFLKLFT